MSAEQGKLWACGRPTGPYRGKFPLGFLDRVDTQVAPIKHHTTEVLFPFGGATPDRSNWVVNDVDTSLDVDTHHDAQDLPAEWTDRFDVVLSDPPYSEDKAADLYGCELASPMQHINEAARVVKPGGYVLVLDWLVHTNWPQHATRGLDDHDLIRHEPIAVTSGPNQRIRVLNIFHKPPTDE